MRCDDCDNNVWSIIEIYDDIENSNHTSAINSPIKHNICLYCFQLRLRKCGY